MRKLLSRTVLLLSLVSLFTDMSSELLYPVLPVYLEQIGFTVLSIGLLEGLANAIIGLSTGYFGSWSDRTGDRISFVRSGYFMSAIGKPMMILFAHPVWIFFSRIMERLGKGVRTGARDALLLDQTSAGNAGKVFGFHRAMDTAGAVVGPLLALVYLHFFSGDYRSLFLIAFLPALVGVGLTFRLKGSAQVKIENTGSKYSLAVFLAYPFRAQKEFKRIVSGIFIFSLFNSADAFLFLMGKLNGMSDSSLISGYIGYNLIYALTAVPFGGLADRIGSRKVFISGLFFFAAAYTGFSVFHDVTSFYCAFVFYGLFSACTESTSKAWLGRYIRSGEKALAYGFLKAMTSISLLLASALTGWLWMAISPSFALIFSATGAMVSMLYFLFFTPKA